MFCFPFYRSASWSSSHVGFLARVARSTTTRSPVPTTNISVPTDRSTATTDRRVVPRFFDFGICSNTSASASTRANDLVIQRRSSFSPTFIIVIPPSAPGKEPPGAEGLQKMEVYVYRIHNGDFSFHWCYPMFWLILLVIFVQYISKGKYEISRNASLLGEIPIQENLLWTKIVPLVLSSSRDLKGGDRVKFSFHLVVYSMNHHVILLIRTCTILILDDLFFLLSYTLCDTHM